MVREDYLNSNFGCEKLVSLGIVSPYNSGKQFVLGTEGREIFLASSWKQRERVRQLATEIRKLGYTVFDFTDPQSRTDPEIPPERFPGYFDPTHRTYWDYIHKPEWQAAIEENRRNLDLCKMLILLLPSGIDATADWAYAVGYGKETFIIGYPRRGERCLVHLWADGWFQDEKKFFEDLSSHSSSSDDILEG